MVHDGFAARLARLVGQRVADARVKATGLSQTELARKVGISRGSIANIEAGRQRPPLETLWAIADALGIEPRQLLPSRADISEFEQAELAATDHLGPEASRPLNQLRLAGSKTHQWVAEKLLELEVRSDETADRGGANEHKASGEESQRRSKRSRRHGTTRQG